MLFRGQLPRRCVHMICGFPYSLEGTQATPEKLEGLFFFFFFELLDQLCPLELSMMMEKSYKSALSNTVAVWGS